ncbi:MAG: peptidase M64 [Bacteroidaceae bacterium]|nr:peptidase M64 [Bacteroidaceae bacterium]
MKKVYILTAIMATLFSCGTQKNASTVAPIAGKKIVYNDLFTGKTMRFDFHHAGNSTTEQYFFDRVIREGMWAGSEVSLINPFDYGEQHFRIVDVATGEVIYKNNYCTLFNEWQTTPEATTSERSFPESVIFPEPKSNYTIEFYARNKVTKEWEKRYSQTVNVADYNIVPGKTPYESVDIHIGGNIANSLDIVLLPDGFTADEKYKFLASCHMWSDALFKYAPFTQNKHRINIRAVWAPSNEKGISKPGTGKWVDNLLGTRFFTFNSERYQMTEEFQKVRDVAACAPYESIFILTNTNKYGGGGIYNFYGLGSAGETGKTGEVYVHEFGHSLMGLGDEYIEKGNTVSALYPEGKEPWEANLTRFVDFNGKWEKKIEEGTPIPTVAEKGTTEKDWKIGAYEGGAYLEKGIYRGWPECMMKALTEFCPVCQEAIIKYLDYICK